MNIKTVTICGSMKFANEMIKIARNLEKDYGYAVIQCVYNFENEIENETEIKNIVNAHWKKIDICDAIYVVNIGGYIGNSTKEEIKYALSKGKEIIYHEN